MVAEPAHGAAGGMNIPLYGWIIIVLLAISNIGWALMIWKRKRM